MRLFEFRNLWKFIYYKCIRKTKKSYSIQKMKFIVLVGSLLFGAVLSQTEDAVAETGVDASTEGGKRAFGFGGPRSGKGFSP